MGAIKQVIDDLDDSSELLQEAKAHLESLFSFAKEKTKILQTEIQDSLLGKDALAEKEIGVSKVLDYAVETHAYHSSNADSIKNAVSSSLRSFVSAGKADDDAKEGEREEDYVLEGIATLISEAVDAFFGRDDGVEGEIQHYHVLSDGVAIIRVDYRGWKRSVTSKSLRDKVEIVSAFAFAKSSADVSGLEFNDFAAIFSNQLRSLSKERIKEELDKVEEVFKAYKSKTSDKE